MITCELDSAEPYWHGTDVLITGVAVIPRCHGEYSLIVSTPTQSDWERFLVEFNEGTANCMSTAQKAYDFACQCLLRSVSPC